MLYYYNRDGIFHKETSREYKTEKGACDRLAKEGEGAVFDETGKMVSSIEDKNDIPEGALDTNADGSVPAFNVDNEPVGTADAETVAEAAERFAGELGQPDRLAFDGMEELAESYETRKSEQAEGNVFTVQTTCDSLRIRAGAGKDYRIVGHIREKAGNKKKHTIVEERDGWGKLKNGEGWIELAYTKR